MVELTLKLLLSACRFQVTGEVPISFFFSLFGSFLWYVCLMLIILITLMNVSLRTFLFLFIVPSEKKFFRRGVINLRYVVSRTSSSLFFFFFVVTQLPKNYFIFLLNRFLFLKGRTETFKLNDGI